MKDNRRKKIYMALGGVAVVAMMGISLVSIRGCTRSDVATPTEATATDAVSEVTTVVNKTTEVVTTEKSKSNNKKGGSISSGVKVKKDHNTKESTSEEKSADNNTKTPGTTEYTGNTEEPTTQRQADNDGGSTRKPPKKDDGGKKNPQPTTQSPTTPTTEEATTREPVIEKPTTEEPVTTEHQHNWVEVKHEAEVKPAWREEVHTTETHVVCNGCGEDFYVTGHKGDYDYYDAHSMSCGASYASRKVDVVSYVDHPEETIKAAYTSYKCSTCGATK